MLIRATNLSQKSFTPPDDWGQGSRGCFAGGGGVNGGEGWYFPESTYYITISSLSNSISFGTTGNERWRCTGAAGQGRGLISGGTTGIENPGPGAHADKIEYVTIATPGNASAFGDLIMNRVSASSTSNGTRALIFGGQSTVYGSVTHLSSIDYVTIPTLGNATNFGTVGSMGSYWENTDATGNGTYGMCIAPVDGGGQANDKYDYVAIDTPGNTTAFGGMGLLATEGCSANSNGSRAIWAGGYDGGNSTKMDYMTWSTPSNAVQFGTMRVHISYHQGCEDGSRGIMGGGSGDGNAHIEYYPMDGSPTSSVVTADFGSLYQAFSRQNPAAFAG